MKQPGNPFHPGEILLEGFLQPAENTQTTYAKQPGWTCARLNELIKGKWGTTVESARSRHGRGNGREDGARPGRTQIH
jgi:plasmid maintenance system antidote protein VapI